LISFYFGEFCRNNLIKNSFINGGKEAFDIKLKIKRVFSFVFADLINKFFQTGNSGVAPFFFSAGKRIINKPALKYRFNFIDKQVMDDPVAKISGKNFPEFWIGYDKTNRTAGMICVAL
jgi:hypothetical protein